MTQTELAGVLVALVTPLTADGSEIDVGVLGHTSSGSSGKAPTVSSPAAARASSPH